MSERDGNACFRIYEVRVKKENCRQITKVNKREVNVCFRNYEVRVIKGNCG
jgi:hypothetical protein